MNHNLQNERKSDTDAQNHKPALHRRRRFWLAVGSVCITTALILGLLPGNADATRHSTVTTVSLAEPSALTRGAEVDVPLQLPSVTPDNSADTVAGGSAPDTDWYTVNVKKGDTLGAIFARIGVSSDQLQQIVDLNGDTTALKHINPGETFRFKVDAQGQLQELAYDTDAVHILNIRHDAAGFQAHITERPIEHRLARASAEINSSLFEAAQSAGLDDNITLKLVSIFNYDIDFALDIQRGDHFAVVFEEDYVDGRKVRNGEILAAEFTNGGKTYRALRYTDPAGMSAYYAPDGKNLRKAFLRTPVEFTRISSGFSLARLHPILNRIRAHKGVDYAAPMGTPVKATGDGIVAFAGRKGGYGNVVMLKHGNHYETVYGHLSRFARGLHRGMRVTQGETIAYVGMTGLATGPHLHYEVHIDGVYRDPLRVKTLIAEPVADKYRLDFLAKAQPMLSQLNLLHHVMVAYRQP